MIGKNNGESNAYTFSNADFEGVKFNDAIQYVHLAKEEREEESFFGQEEEYDNKNLPVPEFPLFLEQRVFGVEISDLPCFTSGKHLNLTSDDMAYLRQK